MAAVGPFINRMGEDAVWRARVLGDRDAVTGHPAITWISGLCFDCDCFDPDCFLCDYNIKVMVKEVTTRDVEIAGARATEKRIKFYTYAPINKDDEVDYHGETFIVEMVQTPHYLLAGFRFQDCVMIQRSFYGSI